MRTTGFVLLLATTVSAQTFIVDAKGGSGSHFRDLPAAISKVPDGAILRVRPGVYSMFTLMKGLTIIGDHRDTVSIRSPWRQAQGPVIGPTRPDQRVLIAGVTFYFGNLTCRDAKGPLVFDDVALATQADSLHIVRCADVHLHRLLAPDPFYLEWNIARLNVIASTVQIANSVIAASMGRAGGDGIQLYSSQAFIADTTIRAGRGIDCSLAGVGNGGNGISARLRSTVHILGGLVQGGKGGDACLLFPIPGDGGAGVELDGGSVARLDGTVAKGGIGGLPTGKSGPGFRLLGGSRIWVNAASRPAITRLRGTPARNATVQLTLTGPPNAHGLLLLGLTPLHLPLWPQWQGPLLLTPQLLAGPFPLSAQGTLSVPLRLAASWPLNIAVHAQFVTFGRSAAERWASNSLVVVATR